MNDQRMAPKGRRLSRACLALSLVCLVPSRQPVLTAADDARSIIEEAQRRTESKSQRYDGLLKSFDSGGKVTEKQWTYERIGANGQSKVVIRFTSPAEVKGVALLIANHPDRASDQWMWTPAIERDRRIALQDRSTRFFGTDFSFEDLEERDVNQYDYSSLPDESVGGAPCWTIQSTPKQGKASQYTKSVIWIRKDNYSYARVDLSIKDAVVRRLTYADIRAVQNISTAHDLTMADLRRGSRTQLILDKVQYNLPLKDDAFTLEAIRR